ncbi:MAG TPA: phosphatase PAP2 family protein [Burkholderiales bacterium]|nr:phosphatase PAP2 family protein [Burkholderiales bacterium]
MPVWKRLALGAIAGALCLFALIAANIAAGDPLVALDAAAARWVLAHRTPALTLLMLGVTHAHAPFALCVYASIAGSYCYRRRLYRWVTALALAVPVGLALNFALKLVFRRARPVPGDAAMTLASYSFPSGHAAGATLFWGVLAAYAMTRTASHRARAAVTAAWLGLVALVAFSRVYLGVHYVSDVLAACAWSLAWLAAALLVATRVRPSNGHA